MKKVFFFLIIMTIGLISCEEETNKTVEVTSVSIVQPATTTLDVGETLPLTAIVLPENATDKTVTWKSNDTDVVTVGNNGVVTALALGTTTITVTTNDGEHIATCKITVVKKVTSVSLDKDVLTLEKGETASLTATVSPDDATDKYVTWTSNNTSAVMVANGVVFATGIGTATITAITRDGEHMATCIVTVPGVMFEKSELVLEIGEAKNLPVTIVPANEEVTWTSSNSSVAMVANGVIFAVTEGTVTITVTTNDGRYQATCIVAVNPMTMTTSKFGEVSIGLAGLGTFTINWGDGSEIETHTLLASTELDFWGWPLLSMYFHIYTDATVHNITITGGNITDLSCQENQLSSLYVNNNKTLKRLHCDVNQLINLNVTGCTALKRLQCSQNQLTNLDVSKNTALTELWCYINSLKSLDVRNNTELTYLSCDSNPLMSLDVSNNTELTGLSCSWNQLTSLDVSNNTKLTNLVCVENQLTNLDMSFNTVLTWLDCRANNLSTAALNALFRTLHNNDVVYIQTGKKNIHIGNNPGTSDCNQNIAEEKGWEVNKSSQL